jgi:hypothetical protein
MTKLTVLVFFKFSDENTFYAFFLYISLYFDIFGKETTKFSEISKYKFDPPGNSVIGLQFNEMYGMR